MWPTSSSTPSSLGGLPELRIDPLTGLKTIVAGERASRPGGGFSAEPQPPLDPETDPFLEGHEDRTPPEVYALRPGGGGPDTPGWQVRVVPNLYPALANGSQFPVPRKTSIRWPPVGASPDSSLLSRLLVLMR